MNWFTNVLMACGAVVIVCITITVVIATMSLLQGGIFYL